jgi:glucosamine--fructose-6-phosphate aminotransferase (isomerizing)
MCGIIAVLRRPSRRQPPNPEILLAAAQAAAAAFAREHSVAGLRAAAEALGKLDQQLRGVPGLLCLLRAPEQTAACQRELEVLDRAVAAFELQLDQEAGVADDVVELRNAAIVQLKDALWSVLRDRIPNAVAVRDLANGDVGNASTAAAFASLQTSLAALDRLEVRGRDSAGVSVLVYGADLGAPRVKALLEGRTGDPLFQDGSVRVVGNTLNLVYKHAAEIGELGDNVRTLRMAIKRDALLQTVLQQPRIEALVLGHTRWASVGIISEPNAHPLNQEELGAIGGPYVLGALNGDVDNHKELEHRHRLAIQESITTDAKIIPVLVSRLLADGQPLAEAFRRTVAAFEGSVAIAVAAAGEPGRLALALRGSGQALYVGVAEDAFVVASEPYGVIEECHRYLRLDGETPGNDARPDASRGQVVLLDSAHAGELDGIRRCAYDGTMLDVAEAELKAAVATTRDIDRGAFRHFLHKEITEAPRSLQKTLRGRIVRQGGKLRAALPLASLSQAALDGLLARRCRRIVVIGQGTAAVAGQAVAAALQQVLARTAIEVRALPATELSGFGLVDDMRDTLVVAISQSGTTTDTNRTVDLVRARGAIVLAVVNRRGSDLCDKADGVVFTSDGRDVEMSVASTKAFYAQCAAGWLLALAIARAAGVADDHAEHELLTALVALPKAMQEVLGKDAAIAAIAEQLAPTRRSWALVGNGDNRIAAEEIRIKLSELCYKSIACDATEDKKHIDLSSEPLILVCAAGLQGSNAGDVAKEVAIYRAHKACPIVIATAGETRFGAAAAVVHVPPVHPALAFILSTMVGHLFGYRAALALDALALPLRRARGAIETVVGDAALRADVLASLRPLLEPHWREFRRELLAGRYDSALEARTAARLTSLCNFALGLLPIDAFSIEFGVPGTPGVVVDALTAELTTAIDQLTRPVDAIKHQAKTVTVGISRADETLLTVPLVRAVLAAGVGRERIGYRDLRAIAGLDAAVLEVLGSTRYRIDGDVARGQAQIAVVERRGIAANIPSRTAGNPALRGTKHLVAMEKSCLVARGRSDDRTVLLVPEIEQDRAVGITLLHLRCRDRLPASALHTVLGSYRNRFAALKDAVTETEPEFDEDLLADVPVLDLLTEPIGSLADRWRQGTLRT